MKLNVINIKILLKSLSNTYTVCFTVYTVGRKKTCEFMNTLHLLSIYLPNGLMTSCLCHTAYHESLRPNS